MTLESKKSVALLGCWRLWMRVEALPKLKLFPARRCCRKPPSTPPSKPSSNLWVELDVRQRRKQSSLTIFNCCNEGFYPQITQIPPNRKEQRARDKAAKVHSESREILGRLRGFAL